MIYQQETVRDIFIGASCMHRLCSGYRFIYMLPAFDVTTFFISDLLALPITFDAADQ